jgi:hypothetical protein
MVSLTNATRVSFGGTGQLLKHKLPGLPIADGCEHALHSWHRCEVRDVRHLVAVSGKTDVADIAILWMRRSYEAGRCSRWRGGRGREAGGAAQVPRDCCERISSPQTIRGRFYCVRYLYATIRATMLAKITSAERDFRIIGLVEWRAADGAG